MVLKTRERVVENRRGGQMILLLATNFKEQFRRGYWIFLRRLKFVYDPYYNVYNTPLF